jgi:hypothetical protein
VVGRSGTNRFNVEAADYHPNGNSQKAVIFTKAARSDIFVFCYDLFVKAFVKKKLSLLTILILRKQKYLEKL